MKKPKSPEDLCRVLYSDDECEQMVLKYGPDLKNQIKYLRDDVDAVSTARNLKVNIEKIGGTIISMRYNDDLAVVFWHKLETSI
jgi:hypothetical protein